MTLLSGSGASYKGFTNSSDGIDLMRKLTDEQRSQLEGMSLAGMECLVASWNNLSVRPIEGGLMLCMGIDRHNWPIKEIIRYVLFIGSFLSLLFLGVAIFIFSYFKSIRCDRITIHIHFMVSLAGKSVMLMIISEPYIFGEEFHYRRVEWFCKFFMALNLYTYLSSINWMFVQGHYINSKITTNVFQENFHIKNYCCFSWGLPVIIVGAWCASFEFVHKTDVVFCWKGYSESKLIWLIVVPVLTALVINVAFLLNIVRILLSRLQLTSNSTDAEQFRRAAKATLVLFPLLGTNNLIFFFNPGGTGQPYYMMANAIIQPLQGILVSILYCFITTDVQEAIKRAYNRFSFQHNFSNGQSRTQAQRSVLAVIFHTRRTQASGTPIDTGAYAVEIF